MTEWLDDEQQAAWLSLVEVVVKLPAALDTQLQRDAGLSHFEYMVLAMLSGQPGRRLTMSALAAATNASPSRLSHVVKRLERAGYLSRRPDPGDGRVFWAELSTGGLTKLVETAPGHVATVRRLVIDPLTPAQLEAVRQAAEIIRAQVDPDGDCPPAG